MKGVSSVEFFWLLYSFLQVHEREEKKKRGQQGRTVHDPVLIGSAGNQFCGNVVMHVGGTKWERRRVQKIIALKQETNEE